MTARLTAPDPVAAAWLAGGQRRAVDALLVSRLERRRIAVVDGNVVDRGLDRTDPLDGALLDALGARGQRDLETVRWRVARDRRLDSVRVDLAVAGLLGERTAWGRPTRPERPARTSAGRRLLRELAAAGQPGSAWEVALHGRDGLTDPALREALDPPARRLPEAPAPRLRSTRRSIEDRHLHITAASDSAAIGGWAALGAGGDCGGGGDGGC